MIKDWRIKGTTKGVLGFSGVGGITGGATARGAISILSSPNIGELFIKRKPTSTRGFNSGAIRLGGYIGDFNEINPLDSITSSVTICSMVQHTTTIIDGNGVPSENDVGRFCARIGFRTFFSGGNNIVPSGTITAQNQFNGAGLNFFPFQRLSDARDMPTLSPGDFLGIEFLWETSTNLVVDPYPKVNLHLYYFLQPDFSDKTLLYLVCHDYNADYSLRPAQVGYPNYPAYWNTGDWPENFDAAFMRTQLRESQGEYFAMVSTAYNPSPLNITSADFYAVGDIGEVTIIKAEHWEVDDFGAPTIIKTEDWEVPNTGAFKNALRSIHNYRRW